MVNNIFPGILNPQFNQCFAEVEWKSSWFKNRKGHSQGYWRRKKNPREFLENAKRN